MKKILFTLLAGGMASLASAGDSPWLTSYPQAVEQAKKEHKLLLLDFTGSDWCPPCKKLEEDVFSKPAFLDYAKNNLVLVLVDFPVSKPQSDALKEANNKLQAKFNVEGYPTEIVLQPDEAIVWKHIGYVGGGPNGFIAEIAKAKKK